MFSPAATHEGLKEKLDNLQIEKEQKDTELQDLASRFDQSTEEVSKLQNEVENLRESKEQALQLGESKNREVEELLQQLAASATKLDELSSHAEKDTTCISELEKTNEILGEQLEVATELGESKNREVEELLQQLAAGATKLDELSSHAEKDMTCISELEKTNNILGEQLEVATELGESKNREVEELLQQLATSATKLDELSSHAEKDTTCISELEKTNNILGEQLEVATEQLNVRKDEIESIQAELDKLQALLQEQTRSFEKQIQELEASNCQLSEKVEHASSSTSKKDEEITSLEAKVTSLEQDVVILAEGASKLQEEKESTAEKLKVLEMETEDRKSLLKTKGDEVLCLEKELNDLQEKFDTAVGRLEKSLEESTRCNEEFTLKFEQQEQLVSQKEAELSQLVSRVESSDQELGQMRVSVNANIESFKDLEMTHAELCRQHDDVKDLMKTKESALEHQSQELDELHSLIDNREKEMELRVRELEGNLSSTNNEHETLQGVLKKRESEAVELCGELEALKDTTEQQISTLQNSLLDVEGKLSVAETENEKSAELLRVRQEELAGLTQALDGLKQDNERLTGKLKLFVFFKMSTSFQNQEIAIINFVTLHLVIKAQTINHVWTNNLFNYINLKCSVICHKLALMLLE